MCDCSTKVCGHSVPHTVSIAGPEGPAELFSGHSGATSVSLSVPSEVWGRRAYSGWGRVPRALRALGVGAWGGSAVNVGSVEDALRPSPGTVPRHRLFSAAGQLQGGKNQHKAAYQEEKSGGAVQAQTLPHSPVR